MLIFDFDGVLMNSMDEVALTAYNAVTGGLVTFMAKTPSFAVEMFRINRFRVQQIGDAIPLMKWCLEIKADDIYSGDRGVTKTENMQSIRERFGRQQFSFIDDSVKNLKELDIDFNRGTRTISLLLAAWGYTRAEDAGIAAEAGYRVVSQSDVIALLNRGA
jgi:hypothetical protein